MSFIITIYRIYLVTIYNNYIELYILTIYRLYMDIRDNYYTDVTGSIKFFIVYSKFPHDCLLQKYYTLNVINN